MKYAKPMGVIMIVLHAYFFLETFFWQGPIMPAWRFFLGVFGPLMGVVCGVYLIEGKK